MKNCKKCNHKNDNNAKYCEKCGAKLEGAKNIWIVIMIIIILILLGIIFFFVEKSSGNHASHDAIKNSKIEKKSAVSVKETDKSSSKETMSSSSVAKQSSSTDNTRNLDSNHLSPAQTAVAIAYWANENGVDRPWSEVSNSGRNPVIDIESISDSDQLSDNGSGIKYVFSEDSGLGYGGAIFYTLSDNYRTVNLYTVGNVNDGSTISPKMSNSISNIVNDINQAGMAEQVRQAANNIQIKQNNQ